MFDNAFITIKIITALYAAPLLVAAAFDFWTYRIPNVVTGTFVILYFVCAAIWGFHVDWLSHLGAFAAVLIVGLGLFRFGIFGGGDIKLLAAVALWLGLTQYFVIFLLVTGMAGGALALVLLAVRSSLSLLAMPFPGYWPEALIRPRAPIPYGVAVVVGALWVTAHVPFVLS